jgi:hypothetical protein
MYSCRFIPSVFCLPSKRATFWEVNGIGPENPEVSKRYEQRSQFQCISPLDLSRRTSSSGGDLALRMFVALAVRAASLSNGLSLGCC